MKINDTEMKARFFAQYIGCGVCVLDEPKEHWWHFDKNESGLILQGVIGERIIIRRIAEEVFDRFDQCVLSLKPLSLISDGDALAVARMNRSLDPLNLPGIGVNKEISYAKLNIYFLIDKRETADFLRSKSYALPFMQYSVEQLVSMGWIKLTES